MSRLDVLPKDATEPKQVIGLPAGVIAWKLMACNSDKMNSVDLTVPLILNSPS